jgi:LPS export ABC transporter permease LptF
MRFTPSLVWRYVFREVMGPVLLGLMVYVLVFLMNALFELAELAIKKEMPPSVVLRLLIYLLPRVLEMTLPMAALLGILIGIGRLSADSELVALRASGASYLRIVSPVLVLALTCWGISSVLIHRIEPRAQYKKRRLFSEQLYSADLRREMKPRVFFEEIRGMLIYADEVYQGGDFLERVFIHQTDADGHEVVTLARRAQIDYDRHSGTAQFFLENGTNHTMTPGQPESYQISRFEKQKFVRPPDDSFKMRLDLLSRDSPKNYQEQSLEELGKSVQQAGSITHAPTRDRVIGSIMVTMHERFALPFACLAFAFVGIPLGIANRRGGKASGFSLSIGIAIVYWLLYLVGQNLVREGKLSPIVGMWAANALLAALGLFLLFLRERFEGLDVRYLVPESVRVRFSRFFRFGPIMDKGSAATTPDELERARAELDSSDLEAQATLSRRRIGHIVVGVGIAAVGLAAFYLTPFLTAGLVLMATSCSTTSRNGARRPAWRAISCSGSPGCCRRCCRCPA